MQIRDCLEATRYFPKIGIGINLFKKGLGESILIRLVFFIWSSKDLVAVFPHALISEIGPAISASFLAKAEPIFPSCGRVRILRKVYFNCNLRIAPRCQATDFGEPAPVLDSFLKAASLCFYDISKEAKNVEEVGFPGRIRTYDELTFAKMNINLLKITPVFRDEVIDNQNGNSRCV